jgi:hypothetical protein
VTLRCRGGNREEAVCRGGKMAMKAGFMVALAKFDIGGGDWI